MGNSTLTQRLLMNALGLLLISILGASATSAQSTQPEVSLGVHFGAFAPFGDGADHRYAPDVQLLGRDFLVGGELELHLRELGLCVFLDYARLDTGDWEDFARSRGDEVSASASMVDYGLRFKYYLMRGPTHSLNLSLGGGQFDLRGKESFATRSYDYDFLRGGFGLLGGLGYRHQLNPDLALSLEARAVFVFEGVEYADGEVRDFKGLPVTAGVSYTF